MRRFRIFAFLVLGLLLIQTGGLCLAQGCVDYENYIHYLGSGDDIAGNARDVVVADFDNYNWGALASAEGDVFLLELSDAVDFGDDGQDHIELPGEALDLCFYRRKLFVAAGFGGLQIVKISGVYSGDCSHEVYDLSLQGIAMGVEVTNNRAYVANGFGGVCVVDVQDYTNPVFMERIPLFDGGGAPCFALDLCIHEGKAYVATGKAGLVMLNLANPDDLTVIDTPGFAHEVQVVGDRIFVADDLAGLLVFDLGTLALLDAVPVTFPDYGTFPVQGLEIDGDRAYLACDELGLVVVDISDPASGEISGWLDSPGHAQGIALWHHSFVIIADGDRGVFAVDVMNTDVVPVTGDVQVFGGGYDIASDGEHIYVANGVENLWIFDATTFDQVGTITLSEQNHSVEIAGDLLYIGGEDAFFIYNVVNPADPIIQDSLDLDTHANGMAIDGNHVYLACDSGDVLKVNISTPEDIYLVAQSSFFCWGEGVPSDVALAGDYVLVTQDEGPMAILNASDLSVVSCFWTEGAAAVEVLGDVAYLAQHDCVELVNLSDPEFPYHMWDFEVPGRARDVVVHESGGCRWAYLAYGSDGYGDVVVMNVSDGQWDPLPYGSADAPDDVRAITLAGDDLFMLSDGGLLRRAPAQCACTGAAEAPALPSRLGSYPNPFNPATTINFEQPELGHVELRVYDISGRLLRTLIDGPLGAGHHTVVWDGRDDAGRLMTSGVYFARMTGEGAVSAVSRLVLIK